MYCCVIFPSPSSISLRAFWGSLWMVHVNHNLSIGVWLWQCCSSCQWNIAYISARERTASDQMLVQFPSISAPITVGLLSGFLLRSYPCPVCSLSKLYYLPLCQPRPFDLSMFIPILSAVCFGAFISFSKWPNPVDNNGFRGFGSRYYDPCGTATRMPPHLWLAPDLVCGSFTNNF